MPPAARTGNEAMGKNDDEQILKTRSTLNDVARGAGVSASTVSSVLSGNAGARRISQDTFRKVHRAASELGYTPSLLHRSMRRGRTHIISLFNAFRVRSRGDLYLDRLAGAVEQAGGELGYDVLVHSNFRRQVEESYEFLNGGLADGLVLFGSTADDPLLPLLRASRLPTVLIAPRQVDPGLPSVVDDEAMGLELVASALVDRGHRSIAAVVEQAGDVLDPTGRLQRLRAGLSARGVALGQGHVVVYNGQPREAVQALLAMSPQPTAVFVWHDRNAYRIVEACEELGVKVPQQLSVVGYDGLIWPSTSGHVVASVEVPVSEMAEVGVSILDRLIEGHRAPRSRTLPVRFLPGTTLGPLVT